jgi:serine/threonine-protein kinase RsbW
MSEPAYGGRQTPPEPRSAERLGGSDSDRIGKTYPARADCVAEARTDVTDWLRARGADDLMVGDIAVALSEACTNVVVHAYTDRATDGLGRLPLFRVAAQHADDAVTIAVTDGGRGMTPRPDSPGVGLGLPLMASLTDHVDIRTGADGIGTVVAMLFSEDGARRRML